MTRTGAGARLIGAAAASTVLVACGGASAETSRAEQTVPRSPLSVTTAPAPGATPPTSAPPSPVRREPRISFLSVPELGLHDAPVVRYRGRPDDGPGTLIQNRGRMASPRGPRGGVGPGEVGNLIVTGHRTSHGAPLAELPSLRAGDEIRVRSGRTVHVYEVTRTRWTSFRSAASRRAQEAAVPGRPGLVPRRPMLTLSTCATPEDHARGNYWADRFGNPEHRIDKIAVLVRVHRRG
jgi:sortase A